VVKSGSRNLRRRGYMKLYSWDIAPNPRRVRIFLAEKGLDIPVEDVGVPGKPILKPEFLARFPHRRVPLLELDDGTCIGEAMAICRYFETQHPNPPLMGRDAKEAAIVEMWERLAEWEGMHAISEYFRNAKRAFSGRAVAGTSEPVDQIPALSERGRQRVAAFYEKFDFRLTGRDFVAGDGYSVADITTLCTVDFAAICGLPIPEGCAELNRWHAAVSVRPSAAA
jgi:glutathione S-transferase